MEQSSTAKVVSLHMEPCMYACPNAEVCYHRRKEIETGNVGVLPVNFRMEMLDKGCIIHESICQPVSNATLSMLSLRRNYSITLPYPLFEKEERLKEFKQQVQITVYTAEQARKVLEYQKLFLVKDDQSMAYAIEKHLWNIPFSYMHFCIDQDWVTKEKLQELMYYRMLSNTIGTTVDSCAESWLINGRCPYGHGNYIDITYDGTIRKCPYNKRGVPIKDVYDGTYESLFAADCPIENCRYTNLFTEKADGTN